MTNKSEAKKSETAKREEEVLSFWKEQNIFEKSLEKEAPNGEFVFFDGPPFATGLPHFGSLLSSVVKDVAGRYKTMRGYKVPRRWGWDCHGLPIEHMIEKKLKLETKKDIETLGIDKFNEEARGTVLAYADEWKEYIERIGRWVDFDNSYKTMDNTYIESVWWALKKIHDDKRLYEGRKVLMYCPRCETPLSKAEIAMDNSYKDVTESAIFVKFKVKESKLKVDGDVYMVAWTTTPWTLPGNVALAVGKDITYVLVKKDKETLVVARERLEVLGDKVEVIREISGSELVGITYEPLYEIEKVKAAQGDIAWTVVAADFVTTEDGSGIVHIAPMYGEDDYQLGVANELPVVPLLDATGTYNDSAPELVRGMYHKKGGKYVMQDLEERELLLAQHNHTHSYPHCYRCGTALIYNALTSWFIDIQSVKKKLLKANEDVSWYPEHLKHGRFQHIIETAPDWTISRNRFWASPLPIWKNEKTDEVAVLGSLEELRAHTKKSGNTYFFIRHGQADSNVQHVISSLVEDENHLTEKGKEQVAATVKELKSKKITKIITSPLMRTRETADALAEALDMKGAVVEEERLKEWQLGKLDKHPVSELREACPTLEDRFTKPCADEAETLTDMKRRVGEALYDIENTYQDETILIVGHEYTGWLAECAARGADMEKCIEIRGTAKDYVDNAEVRELDFVPLPHNKEYEIDLHRPYIDDLTIVNKDGERLVRIPEVVDCWVESGSMPFASEHFPHENKKVFERRYPGDFIAEYIAQTRTWFYYMHAMGVLLFGESSFKNCVTTGTILAADGAKMSKSKQNYTDPLANVDMYGADASRLYMLGSVVMSAEDLSFKDEELREVHNRFVNMLWNSYKFYEMNAGEPAHSLSTCTTKRCVPKAQVKSKCSGEQKTTEQASKSENILDEWVLSRLHKLIQDVTRHMDEYDTVRTARATREFIADFSQWYVRRSRDRFKSEDEKDKQAARATMREVLRTFAKLVAPLTPYIAESVYRGVEGEKESVHLAEWPEAKGKIDKDLIEDMTEVRRIASLALEARQKEGIKVRQPLAMLTVSSDQLKDKTELIEVLLGEINVKKFVIDTEQKDEVLLDTVLTDELKTEGGIRDIVRAVQAMRKKEGLSPEDVITLTIDTSEEGKILCEAAQKELKRVAGAQSITFASQDDTVIPVKTGDVQMKITLKRV